MIFHTNEHCNFDNKSKEKFDEICDEKLGEKGWQLLGDKLTKLRKELTEKGISLEKKNKLHAEIETCNQQMDNYENPCWELSDATQHLRSTTIGAPNHLVIAKKKCSNNFECRPFKEYRHAIVYSSETNHFYFIPDYEKYLHRVFDNFWDILEKPEYKEFADRTIPQHTQFLKKHIIQAFYLASENFDDNLTFTDKKDGWEELGQIVITAPDQIYWEGMSNLIKTEDPKLCSCDGKDFSLRRQ
jgi:hypothetical protein